MIHSQLPTKSTFKKNSGFAQDVLSGLSATPKKLPSKYFYDESGDRLFQQIMNMPEYYLTDAEYDIFTNHKQGILQLLGEKHFDLFELGAGDGTKTKILLQHFLDQQSDFTYRPIDISSNVLVQLEQDLQENLPLLDVKVIQGDYFEVLGKMSARHGARKVVLFLGANIGNLSPEEAFLFLQKLKTNLSKEDLLLIGFDLKKDPEIILEAYNDRGGITAAFNLNLLHRMNKELGANFDVDAFKHWETYDPISGATRSFIVSTKSQEVEIQSLNQSFSFDAWEAIDVELSQKYSLVEVEKLAKKAGFKIRKHFFDQQRYFVDSLWEV